MMVYRSIVMLIHSQKPSQGYKTCILHLEHGLPLSSSNSAVKSWILRYATNPLRDSGIINSLRIKSQKNNKMGNAV